MDLQGPQERLCSCSRCSPRPAGTKWEPKPYDHKHARAPKDAGDASCLTPVRFPSHSLLFPCSSSPVWLVSPDKPRHPVGVKVDWPPANCFFPEQVPGLLQTIASLLPLITFFWEDSSFSPPGILSIIGCGRHSSRPFVLLCLSFTLVLSDTSDNICTSQTTTYTLVHHLTIHD